MERRTFLGGALTASAAWLAAQKFGDNLPSVPFLHPKDAPLVSWTDFLANARAGKYSDVFVSPSEVSIITRDKQYLRVIIPEGMDISALLKDADVKIWFEEEPDIIQSLSKTFRHYMDTYGPTVSFAGAAALTGREIAHEIYSRRLRVSIHEDEEWSVACHETGHALASILAPGAYILDTATIIPGHGYLGRVSSLPMKKYKSLTLGQLNNELIILMAGRCAEKIIFDGDYSVGAQGDLEKARDLVRTMFTKWGMSENIGPTVYGELYGLSGAWNRYFIPDQRLAFINSEIETHLRKREEATMELLTIHKPSLENVARALLERKTMDAVQIHTAARIDRPSPGAPRQPS